MKLAVLGVLLLAGSVEAAVKTQAIDYKQGDTTLKGYLAYDDALAGKRPGVVVVPEWWGLTDYPKKRAAQLAALGYAALAIDMYGDGKTTDTAQQAGAWAGQVRGDRNLMRARAQAGLDTLRQQPMVDAKRVAAIGYCFGGTTVLELARSGADVAGVVSFHGGLDAPSPAAPGRVKAKVLVCTGGDDPSVPPEQVTAFEEEMRKAGADWQVIVYGGAVHAFTNPDVDRHNLQIAKYNPEADRRSWAALRAFFDEIFK